MKTITLALLICASVVSHAQVVRVDTMFGIRSQMECSELSIQNIDGMAALADGTTFAIGSFHQREADEFTHIAKHDQLGVYVPGLPIYSILLRGDLVAIGQQKSGRIVVCYSQQTFKVCPGIIGFDQFGEVDTSFSSDSVTGGFLQAMCIDRTDRIILGGRHWDTVNTTQYACTRLTKDGAVDAAFNRPIMKGRIVYSIAVDSLGRLYVGGLFDSIGARSRHSLARLSPNGDLDTTFDVRLDSGTIIFDIVVQDSHGIVVRQYRPLIDGTTPSLARYTFNGSLDSTFGPYDRTGRNPGSITLLPSGQLMVAGQTSMWTGLVERLNANGSIDTSFTMDGLGQGQILSICPEHTGDFIAYGWGDVADRVYHQVMFRFDSTGGVNHDYNVHCGLDGSVGSVAPLKDGRLFIGGSQVSHDTLALGPSFLTDRHGGIVDGYRQGEYPIELLGSRSIVKSHILTNNVLMVLDQTQIATDVGPAGLSTIYRLLPDGSRDAEYVVDPSLNNRIRTACFNDDGSAFIAGTFQTVDGVARQGIAKLNPVGKVDLSFDPGSGVDTAVFAIAPAGEGVIVVGGAMSRYDGKPVKQVIRLFANGDLDTTFKTPWILEPPTGRGKSAVHHVAIDSGNNVVISGDFQSVNNIIYGNVIRLRANGQLDRTFAMDIISSYDLRLLALDDQDRPLIASGSRVLRLNNDGTADTTFGCTVDGSVAGIHITSVDTLYVYGEFDAVNSISVQNVARLLVNDNTTSTADDVVPVAQDPPLRLHPNPAKEQITVELATTSEPCTVLLLDCTGQIIQRSNNVTADSHNFDVQGVPIGFYIVMVQCGNRVSCSSFIKSE